MNFHINPFAQRHFGQATEYSRTLLSKEKLLELAKAAAMNGYVVRGDKAGTCVITVSKFHGFVDPVQVLNEDSELVGIFAPRLGRIQHEAPRQQIRVKNAQGTATDYAQLVFWSTAMLAKNNETYVGDPDDPESWELITMMAVSEPGVTQPMEPETLMANFFEESGGTKGDMTDEEFIVALRASRAFWKNRAKCA